MSLKQEVYIDTGKATCFTRIYQPVSEDPKREKIVLVHGLGMSGTYMNTLAKKLAVKYTVYVPDLPGFGNSSKPTHVLNIQELAVALEEWAQAFPVKRAWYLGNSMGCQVIAGYFTHSRESVKGVVLQGLVVDPCMRKAFTQFIQFIKLAFYEPLSLIMIMIKDYWKCGLKRFLKTFAYSLIFKTEVYLPRVNVPALVVWGENDKLISRKWAYEAAELLPFGSLKVVKGHAHAINFTAPDLMAHLTAEFIESTREKTQEINVV